MPLHRFLSCCSLGGCVIVSGSVLALEAGDEGGGTGGVCDPTNQPWIYPVEAEDLTDPDSWARFAWDGFVALNWPQLEGGQPGEPDTNATLCDSPDARPAFLQWMQKQQLLLEGGVSPGTWAQPTYTTPMYEPPGGGPKLPLLGALSKTTDPDLVDEFDEAFSHRPLIDQDGNYVLFQIFLNKSEFEYFSQNGYYDAVNQYQAFQPGGSFRPFPDNGAPDNFDPPITLEDWARQGAIELKASWKQLNEDEIASGRFFMQDVYFASNISASDPPCGPVTVGLVGLHVLQLTPNTGSTWFWATFEQIDNVEVPEDHPTGVPSFNPGPDGDCPPPVPDGYFDGYTCNQTTCTPAEPPFGSEDCPPQAPKSGILPDVCEADPSKAVNVSRIPEMAIPANIEAINQEYRSQLPAPWRYYQLLNTIQPMENGPCCVPPIADHTVNTCYMTNVTMETYTQYYDFISLPKCDGTQTTAMSMNCTDCHAVAKPLGAPRYEDTPYPNPSYQVFSFMLNNADSSCPGDFNHDRVVNGIDLGMLLGAWGTRNSLIDLDESGHVNGADLTILMAEWGDCPVPGAPGRSDDAGRGTTKEDAAALRRYLNALERE
ncbi:MAG: hypothetical protein CMJ57_09565 [Planctomycetaceae bacterium]|nr:hypothetical protein [Planctomycetaceae bacterium]